MCNEVSDRLSYDDWFDHYCPIENPLDDDASYDGTMFETYGAELQQVRAADPSRVWTVVDGDGELVICSGFRVVNRIGYFITERPWTGDVVVEAE